MVAGPGLLGIATCQADFFGIDFFGDDDKSDMHHPRPGSEVSAQTTRAAPGVTAAEAPTAKIGGAAENVDAPETTAMRSVAGNPEAAVTTEGLGGGGGVPRANTAGRPTKLPHVSAAPAARRVVIRRAPASIPGAPADAAPTLPQSPVVALAAPQSEFPEPEGRPAPAVPPAPASTAPRAEDPLTAGGGGQTPDSYRIGYAEYLRSADTSDLFIAALPGAAGIAGFTLVGTYAGYR
jgi:hypothetical protein